MPGLFRFRRAAVLAVAGLAALVLASCSDFGELPKHLRPLPSAMRALIEKKGMEQTAPILVRIFKEESTLEVWKREKASSRYALLKSYEICKWSGDLGPKKAQGDRQAPEGFYTITPAQLNPKSSYYLSFNIGYPNAYDRALGRTGDFIMVHGACSSRGCYSMTDEQIQEIYTLARLAFQGGQRDFQVQAFPFRMTPENMAEHRRDPNFEFWKMLKAGYDHFDVIRQPPKIDVCSQRYVFNSVPQDGVTISPSGACPPMSVPDSIRVAVEAKERKDDAEMQVIAARLDAKEGRDNATMLAAVPAAQPAEIDAPALAPISVAAAPVSLDVPAAPAAALPVQPAAPAASTPVAVAAAPEAAPARAEVSLESSSMATAYMPPPAEKRGGIRGFIGSFFR
jgi:murein L,D-transpeptidase YafK